MSEEKIKILKMIEDGKITAKEGMDLLNAVEDKKDKPAELEILNNDSKETKWLRVRVIEPNDNTKVKINIPISLVDVALKVGSGFSTELNENLKGVDVNEIVKAIKEGAEGKIVDVEDDNGTKVEVTVE